MEKTRKSKERKKIRKRGNPGKSEKIKSCQGRFLWFDNPSLESIPFFILPVSKPHADTS